MGNARMKTLDRESESNLNAPFEKLAIAKQGHQSSLNTIGSSPSRTVANMIRRNGSFESLRAQRTATRR